MDYSSQYTTPAYPPELLTQPDVDKRKYFHEVRIGHPRIQEARKSLSGLAAKWGGTDIGLLIGPAGVGKSVLTHKLIDDINKRELPLMQANPSAVPAIWMELMAYGEGFSWVAAYEQILSELGEPLIDKKTMVVFEEAERKVVRSAAKFGSRIVALRVALEEALRNRETQVIALDEPVAMIRQTAGPRLASHMDTFKSLTNRTGTRFLLAGAYDLYALMLLNGQVARRTQPVHLTRYKQSVAADRAAVAASIGSLQRHLPLAVIPNLVPMAEPLMESCIGCVGLIKSGMQRGLLHALDNGGVWTEDSTAKVFFDKNQQLKLLEEALAGEAMMEGDTEVIAHLAGLAKKKQRLKKAA